MIHKWFYKFVRRRTAPIEPDQALLWKRRLSIIYGVLAWNAFGVVCFAAYKGKADWANYYGLKSDEEASIAPATAWARTLGIKNATVYRMSGFQKVGEYKIVDGQMDDGKTEDSSPSIDAELLSE